MLGQLDPSPGTGHAGLSGFHGLFLGHVTDGQATPSCGRVSEIPDFRCRPGRAENRVAFGYESERDIAAEGPSPAPVTVAERPECRFVNGIRISVGSD